MISEICVALIDRRARHEITPTGPRSRWLGHHRDCKVLMTGCTKSCQTFHLSYTKPAAAGGQAGPRQDKEIKKKKREFKVRQSYVIHDSSFMRYALLTERLALL